MPNAKTIGPVTCHPDTGDFEATVRVVGEDGVRDVDCRLRFPIDTTIETVLPALERQAAMKVSMQSNRNHGPTRPGRGAAA